MPGSPRAAAGAALVLSSCLLLAASASPAATAPAAASGSAASAPSYQSRAFNQRLVAVGNARDLIRALQSPSVTNILLAGDVHLEGADLADQLPVRLVNRSVSIAGGVFYNVSDYWRGDQPGVPRLDFSDLWPVVVVANGSSLRLKDLELEGIRPYNDPEVAAQTKYPYATGVFAWPAVVFEDGAKMYVTRNFYSLVFDFCAPEYVQQRYQALKLILGSDIQLPAPDTTLVLGNHTVPTPLTSHTNETVGHMTLYLLGATSYTCTASSDLTGSGATPTGQDSDSGGGGLPAGAWAGIAVGIVAVVAAAAGLAAFLLVRRRRRRHGGGSADPRKAQLQRGGTPASKAGSDSPDGGSALDASSVASLEAVRTKGGLQARPPLTAIDSLLRVRFGDLEGLEIGGLVGRGAFGRVYRGNLRGANVAIKVIEYGVGPEKEPASSGGDPAAEALLLIGLKHPNIVSLIRCSVLKLQDGNTSIDTLPSVSSGSWPVVASSGARTSAGPAAGAGTSSAAAAGAAAGPPTAGGSPQRPMSPVLEHSSPFSQPVSLTWQGVAAQLAPSPFTAQPKELGGTAGGSAAHGVHAAYLDKLEEGQGPGWRPQGSSAGSGSPEGQGSASGQETQTVGTAKAGSRPSKASAEHAVLPNEPGQYEIWLVQEFCERGSLEDAIHRRLLWRPDGSRREALLLGILIDVAQGLCYLHESNVVHGDLKPGNVLLKSAGQGRLTAKIADFGLSKLLPPDKHSLVRTQALGTACYMPPELLSSGRLSRATDVYSFALIMLEAWTGTPPFAGQSLAAVFFSVVHKQERPCLPADLPPAYATLIRDGWQQEPEGRPTMQAVLDRLRQVQSGMATAARSPPSAPGGRGRRQGQQVPSAAIPSAARAAC